MGISVKEYQVAMETFGAKRLPDGRGTRYYDYIVPVFQVADVVFRHSASYYVVNGASDTIINNAMAEFNEKHPGGKNFWYGEIHSVKGLLTVACMLENKYTKELVEELVNETYKNLLSSKRIRNKRTVSKYEFPSMKEPTVALMEELRKLLDEFDNIVNPFCNRELTIREPGTYMNKINIGIAEEDDAEYTYLNLDAKTVETTYTLNKQPGTWSYVAESSEGHANDFKHTYIYHYRSKHFENEDEIVYLWHMESDKYEELPGNIRLKISLITGLAWNANEENKAKLATQNQIKSIIAYLKQMIVDIKRVIIDNITEQRDVC